MALFARRPAPSVPAPRAMRPTSVTAAGSRIEFTGSRSDEQTAKKREAWQQRAWEMYDLLGIVRFPARFMGDSFARIRLFVGVRPDPEAEPVPLVPEGDSELGYTADEARLAIGQLDRLRGPEGGRAEIMRRIGTHLFVPGECYLVGRRADESKPVADDNERWDIYSTDEFIVDLETKRRNLADETVPTFKLKGPSGQPRDLPIDTVGIRIWRPHPRFTTWADSPMRAALPICERLLILEQSIISGALSRAKGPGVWVLPNSMRGKSTGPTDGDGQATKNDPVIDDLITAIGTAIQDPESAYAQVPVAVWVNDDLWKDQSWSDKLITWDRDIDAVAAEQRSEARTEFAVAIDLPPEVLTGAANINHWNLWFIGDDTFQSHVEPYVILADSALTASYLWPALRLEGVDDPERFVIWHDPSELVADPDKGDRSLKAHGAFLISDERARRDNQYQEEDAPSPEEITRRVAIEQALRNPTVMLPAPQGPPAASANGHRITAAAEDALPGFAERIGLMDRTLLLEVQAEADSVMRRALERANRRLKTLAQRDKTVFATISGISAESLQIGPTLGPTLIERFATRDDGQTEDLFAASLLGFRDWFDERTGRTATEAIRMAQTSGQLSDIEAAELERELAADRVSGSDMILAALLGAAGALLLRPVPPTGPGEVDRRLVPAGLIRDGLARAGGGGIKAASMLTGDTVGRVWSQGGISFGAWRWVYGDPSLRQQPFPPHQALDGVEFGDPEDERLGNASAAFPGVSGYWPGDHQGCLCAVERTGARVNSRDAASLIPAGAR